LHGISNLKSQQCIIEKFKIAIWNLLDIGKWILSSILLVDFNYFCGPINMMPEKLSLIFGNYFLKMDISILTSNFFYVNVIWYFQHAVLIQLALLWMHRKVLLSLLILFSLRSCCICAYSCLFSLLLYARALNATKWAICLIVFCMDVSCYHHRQHTRFKGRVKIFVLTLISFAQIFYYVIYVLNNVGHLVYINCIIVENCPIIE